MMATTSPGLLACDSNYTHVVIRNVRLAHRVSACGVPRLDACEGDLELVAHVDADHLLSGHGPDPSQPFRPQQHGSSRQGDSP
jgi:hypothetical protein